MASYITTLQDDDRVNDIIPRTTIPAIADSNGNYLDDSLAASDINKLKNGEINKLESNLAQIETSPSTHAYSAGEFLVYNGILYKAKTSIAVNDSLVVGSNISAQTVSSAISDISASLKIKHITRQYQVTVDSNGVSMVNFDDVGASDYVVFVMSKNRYPFIPVQTANGDWYACSNFHQYSGTFTFDIFYFNYS